MHGAFVVGWAICGAWQFLAVVGVYLVLRIRCRVSVGFVCFEIDRVDRCRFGLCRLALFSHYNVRFALQIWPCRFFCNFDHCEVGVCVCVFVDVLFCC